MERNRRRQAEGGRRSAERRTPARKRFGQHFLEAPWVAKVVDAIDPEPNDTFLEIGPGRGALTRPLAARARRVIAVEIDRDLAAALRAEAISNLQLIQSDVLALSFPDILRDEARPIRVAGNLPYNISSPVLFTLLAAADRGQLLSDATLMLQKEVADRLVATPGRKDYGALAIQVSLLADVERLLTLPPGAFRPPPKVTSAVVRLRFHAPRVDVGDARVFERIVRGMFLQRRKTVANALRPVCDALGCDAANLLQRAGVNGGVRPEVLTLEQIAGLSRAVL